ncbi:MAG: hypothetical protein IPQ08_12740 [Chitinophagaceae bacterium]|nr:hypothetical protein [Chitinophagaceae bacterium]
MPWIVIKKISKKRAWRKKVRIIPADKRYVHNYYFPYNLGNDTLIYLKSTHRQRAGFFIRDKNGEHLIRYRDISLDEQVFLTGMARSFMPLMKRMPAGAGRIIR